MDGALCTGDNVDTGCARCHRANRERADRRPCMMIIFGRLRCLRQGRAVNVTPGVATWRTVITVAATGAGRGSIASRPVLGGTYALGAFRLGLRHCRASSQCPGGYRPIWRTRPSGCLRRRHTVGRVRRIAPPLAAGSWSLARVVHRCRPGRPAARVRAVVRKVARLVARVAPVLAGSELPADAYDAPRTLSTPNRRMYSRTLASSRNGLALGTASTISTGAYLLVHADPRPRTCSSNRSWTARDVRPT